LSDFIDPPRPIRIKPPTVVDGMRVCPIGNPITARDGSTWLKLRTYEQGDERRWLFNLETGSLVEGDPE